ncbi:MAG: T9SS type A sorting domain-containing protein [Chitinophagales bacterium]|nr:T9SS type A sorting domain-containing protein [Chitinophagales bacterium]
MRKVSRIFLFIIVFLFALTNLFAKTCLVSWLGPPPPENPNQIAEPNPYISRHALPAPGAECPIQPNIRRPICHDESGYVYLGGYQGVYSYTDMLSFYNNSRVLIELYAADQTTLITNFNGPISINPGNINSVYPFYVNFAPLNLNPGHYFLRVRGNYTGVGGPTVDDYGFMHLIVFRANQVPIRHTVSPCPGTGPYQVCFDFEPIFTQAEVEPFVEWQVVNNTTGNPVPEADWCTTIAQNGSYTVTAIVGDLSADTPIIINCLPVKQFNLQPLTVTVTPSSYSGCNTTNSFTLYTTVNGGTLPRTYAWSPSAGLSSSTSPNPIFTPANAQTGNYVVTVTEDGGCTATALFANNMAYCCAGYNNLTAHNVTFYDVTTAWLNANFTYVNNNQMVVNALPSQIKVAFNGTLTVNTNFTILNSPNITFGPAAKIVVQTGFTLRIDNSSLKACGNQLWKGIEIQHAGSTTLGVTNQFSLVMANNARTEDALYGVECWGNGRFTISNSTFDKNYIGVLSRNLTNGLSSITGSTFNSSSGILPSWPGAPDQAPSGIKTAFGYYALNNFTAQNVGIAGVGNLFQNINNGIITFNSSVNSTHNRFVNIAAYDNFVTPSGYGVYARDNSPNAGTTWSPYTITVSGNGKQQIANPAFQNTANCIYVQEMNANITQNVFTFGNSATTNSRAIVAQQCQYEELNITDNRISGFRYGIDLLLNRGAFKTIDRNHITVFQPASGQNYSGILLNLTQSADHYMTFIRQDTVVNGRYGIACYNAATNLGLKTLQIQNNLIHMSSSVFYDSNEPQPFATTGTNDLHGIYLNNCPSNVNNTLIQNNTIYGGTNALHRNFARYRKSAITLEGSTGVGVDCNNMYWVGIGLQVRGNCNGTRLRRNNFGLQAGPTTFYDMNYALVYRRMNNINGEIGMQGSPSECLGNQFYPISYSGGFQIYQVLNSIAHPAIHERPNANGNYYDAHQFGNYQSQNANNPPVPATALTSFNCGSGSFMMANGGSWLADDEARAQEIVSGEVVADYEPQFVEGGWWIKQRELYRELLADSTLLYDNTVLQTFKNEKREESVGRFEEWEKELETLREAALIADTFTLQLQKEELTERNTEVAAQELYEVNEKTINAIDLSLLDKPLAELNTDELMQVSIIAHQCPLTGGLAVYKARAIYQTLHREADFDDVSPCLLNSYKTAAHTLTDVPLSDMRFNLMPNPAADIVYLYYTLGEHTTARWMLSNMYGQVLEQGSMSNENQLQLIDVHHLATGLYQLSVQKDGDIIFGTHVSIVR